MIFASTFMREVAYDFPFLYYLYEVFFRVTCTSLGVSSSTETILKNTGKNYQKEPFQTLNLDQTLERTRGVLDEGRGCCSLIRGLQKLRVVCFGQSHRSFRARGLDSVIC